MGEGYSKGSPDGGSRELKSSAGGIDLMLEAGGQVGVEPAAVSRGGISRHLVAAMAGQRGWLELPLLCAARSHCM